jgi:Xaa-Pro dipeptidase
MLINLARARELMKAAGITTLVATTAENVAYLSDFDNPLPFLSGTRAAAVLPLAEDRPATFVGSLVLAGHYTERPSWMPSVEWFGRIGVTISDDPSGLSASIAATLSDATSRAHADLPTALQTALRAAGSSDGLIGVDDVRAMWSLPEAQASDRYVDATELYRQIRAVKTEVEINRLRRAAAINVAAFDAANSALAAGVQWAEITRTWRRTWADLGGTSGFWASGSGEHAAQLFHPESNYEIRAGDVVRFDGGGTFEQYWSDIGGSASLGPMDERLQRMSRALANGGDAAQESIRPGALPDDIRAKVLRAIRSSGIPDFPETNVWGHGVGLTTNELPFLRPGFNAPLEENMVLCFETPYFELGWGGLQSEDTYLVTADGCESISPRVRGTVTIGRSG